MTVFNAQRRRSQCLSDEFLTNLTQMLRPLEPAARVAFALAEELSKPRPSDLEGDQNGVRFEYGQIRTGNKRRARNRANESCH
jgi:hypothetical protein